MRNIIFDLDGTLIDSRPGIFAGIAHAMARLELPVPDPVGLNWVIGPPLETVMRDLLAPHSDDRVGLAALYYREYYAKVGLYDAQPYGGIMDLLVNLNSRGRTLFVGTSKLTPFARTILGHFGLSRHLSAIHGATPGDQGHDKADLFREVLDEHRLDPSETVVVGDRRYDVAGALACGLAIVGVTYGYGDLEELRTAGARVLADSPADLVGIL